MYDINKAYKEMLKKNWHSMIDEAFKCFFFTPWKLKAALYQIIDRIIDENYLLK